MPVLPASLFAAGIFLAAAGILFRKMSGRPGRVNFRAGNGAHGGMALLCLAFFLGGGLRMAQVLRPEPVELLLEENGPIKNVLLTGSLESLTVKDGRATLVLRHSAAELTEPTGKTELGTVRVSCEAPSEETKLCAGCPVEILGKLSLFDEATNPGQFDFRLYYRSLGIRYRLSGTEASFGDPSDISGEEFSPAARLAFALRQAAGCAIDRVFLPEDAGIYRAMLLADRSALDDETAGLFRDGGIFHLMAVSATHISVIFITFYDFLRKLGFGFGGAGLVTAAGLFLYGILTGFGPSVARAVVMALCRFLGAYLGRTYDLLSALSLSMLIISAQSPLMTVQSGFQLSFSAVFAIGIYQEIRQVRRTALIRRTGKIPAEHIHPAEQLRDSFCFSAFVQIYLLPVTLYWFFQYPPYSLLLNLIVIPLLAWALGSGIAAVGLYAAGLYAPEPLGDLLSGCFSRALAGPGHYIFLLYRALCLAASKLPLSVLVPGRPAAWQLGIYAALIAGFTVFLFQRAARAEPVSLRISSRLVIPAVLLLFGRPVFGLTAICADVGQGDAVLLRTPETVILSDCGSSTDSSVGSMRLDPLLRSQGITHVDTILMSHADEDHINGIRWLLEEDDRISVGELVMPAAGKGTEKYEEMADLAGMRGVKVRWFSRGDVISAGKLTLTCLHPFPEDGSGEETGSDRNEDSLVFSVTYGRFSLLLTGDLGTDREMAILGRKDGLPLPGQVTLLKAGHHGSAGSSSEAFLRAISPSYAVISSGKGNRYGHPAIETLQRLESAGTEILRTDEDGAVIIRTGGKRMKITRYRERGP